MDERWVELGDARIFVRSWGEHDAKPVLFWHGVGLNARASLMLNEAGPLLAGRNFHVLALDAPGFGRSPPLERECYHPFALADLVPAMLDRLRLHRAAFIGFSWGGDVGVHVAARHPDRLTALILLDAGYRDPPFDPAKPFEAFLRENQQAWEDACTPSWDVALARARAERRRWNPAIEEAVRAGWRVEGDGLVPSGSPAVVAAIEHGTSRALPSTSRPALAASGLPVLLVASDDAAEDDLMRFGTDAPQAEIHRPGGLGHDVLIDGGPDVVHFVGAWLERLS